MTVACLGFLERGPKTTATGTSVRFWPDPNIFETTTVEDSMLARRLQEVTFLNNRLTIRLVDDRRTDDDSPHGLMDYVQRINRTKTPIHPSIIRFHGKCPGTEIEIAMQWNAGYSTSVHTFVNTVRTHEVGTHEEGLRAALTSVVSRYAKDHKLLRRTEPDLAGDDICDGLAAVIALKIAEPVFEGQTTTKLTNAKTKSFARAACEGYLTRWFDANPAQANVIVRKAVWSADAGRMPRRSHCR